MKVMPVCNIKGGVGKTTTVFNIAVGFASKNAKVIAIDLDGQADLTDQCRVKFQNNEIDENLKVKAKKTIIICLKDPNKVKSTIRKTRYGFDLIPSNDELFSLERVYQSGNTPLPSVITRLAELGYEYCLIDCSPQFSIFLIDVIVCSANGIVIVPGELDERSLKGFKKIIGITMDIIKKTGLEIQVGFLPIKIKDTKAEKNYLEKWETNPTIKELFLPVAIRDDSTTVKKSQYGRPLFFKSAKIAKDYQKLVEFLKWNI